MARNFLNKNSQYVQSLVDFILDTKPYHSKLTETVEEYQFFDNVNVKIEERLLNRAKLDSTWLYNFFSSENPLQRTMPLGRIYHPVFNLESQAVGLTENEDMAGVPFVYSKKTMEDVGPSAVFIRREDGTLEPLQESIDFFTSHGSYQFRIIQTQNTNQFDFIASNQAQMLALDADVGNTVARADLDKVFQLKALPATTLANWEEQAAALLNPLYVATNDEGIIAAATAKTRAAALDVSQPQSAVNRVRALLDEIQVKVNAAPQAAVQTELDKLYDIIDVPNLPQSYEALLNTLDIYPEIDVDTDHYRQEFQVLSSPLFFYQFSDTGIRESGLVNYPEVDDQYLRVYDIKPDFNGSYEEWMLIATPGDYWNIFGSTSGYIGTIAAGESFFSIGKVSFKTQQLGTAPTNYKVSLIPDHKITIHKNAPLETWNIIKVNSIAHNRPQLVSESYGKIQDLNGVTGLVTLLDQSIPSTTIILEAREGGLIFDLTSTEDMMHQGVVNVNQVYNDGRIGFKIVSGVTPFRKGDRFYIAIENRPPTVVDIDLGYGYDLDPYDGDDYVYNNTDSSHPDYNRKIGFWYDGRFTDFDPNSLNLTITEEAVSDRRWRMRAMPGTPIATLKKDGSGPNYSIDLQERTSGTAPDPSLNALPLYSMAGDTNSAPDLFLFYSTQFAVEYSDDNFVTAVNIGTVNVGETFTSDEQGISFTLPYASKPYIAVSSDDGLNQDRVEGGDVFSFMIKNPFPELIDIPIGLVSPNVPRMLLHSDSFYEVEAAHWSVTFTSPTEYTISATRTSDGTMLAGLPESGNLANGLSYKGHGVHFSIVPKPQLYAGDTFVFDTYDEKPSYLVHGSLTGWTKPAKTGVYYWNGKIGFKITEPEWEVYVNGDMVSASSIGFALTRIREDIPSLGYVFSKTPAGYMVSRTDIGVQGFVAATGTYSDKYITVTLTGTSVNEFKLDINAHQYPLFNAQDTIIVKPKIEFRNPRPGDKVVVEKTESGRLSISLSPSSVNIDHLRPITIDQRFIDLNTGHDIPIGATSPYANVLQGFLPTYATYYDNGNSIAEFRDPATRIEYRSAASNELIGVVRPLTSNIKEPIVFEWDLDFYNSYLPLNAEANLITMGTGWNDQVRVNTTESIKFLIGGGALSENYLFRESVNVGLDEGHTINIRTDWQNSFSIVVSDGPFEGFLAGWDNLEYDNEPIGYDEGHPPDLVSLLSKLNLTAEEREAILLQWNNFLQDPNNPPSNQQQWQYLADQIGLDPNPGGLTTLNIGIPSKGLAIDMLDRSTDASSTSIQEASVFLSRDDGNPHDMLRYDRMPLDAMSDAVAMMFTTMAPSIPPTVQTATWGIFDTPLYAQVPARVFEINFNLPPAALASLNPYFSIWLPDAETPQSVPQSIVTKLGPGRYRFSIPQPSLAKILVNQTVIIGTPVYVEDPITTEDGYELTAEDGSPIEFEVGPIAQSNSITTEDGSELTTEDNDPIEFE